MHQLSRFHDHPFYKKKSLYSGADPEFFYDPSQIY
jgi:hypothetical protein